MNKNKKIGIVGRPKKPLTVQEILAQMEKENRQEKFITSKNSVTGDPYSLLYYVAKKASNGEGFVDGIVNERDCHVVPQGKIRHYNNQVLNGENTNESGTVVAVLEKEKEI